MAANIRPFVETRKERDATWAHSPDANVNGEGQSLSNGMRMEPRKSAVVAQKLRVSSIDNENDQTHLEVSELDADGLAARIGELFQKLMDIEGAEKSDASSVTSRDQSSNPQASTAPLGINSGGLTLRASDVHSLVEEKRRRELERKEAAIVLKEREMFLRAALQLLDQRESGYDIGTSVINKSKDILKSERVKDTIRVGLLHKYSHGHVMHGNLSVRYRWHSKIVELRHGSFSYEDQVGDGSGILGLLGVHTGGHGKVIRLAIDSCVCKPVSLQRLENKKDGMAKASNAKSASDGAMKYDPMECIFEITVIDGPQRLWLASSPSDRDQWVRAINTAMVGSAGDFNINDDSGLPQGLSYIPRSPSIKSATRNDVSANTGAAASGLGNLGLDMLSLEDDDQSIDTGDQSHHRDSRRRSRSAPPSSTEGAVAPYAEDIAKFISVRLAVKQAKTREAYKRLLRRLLAGVREAPGLSVPVFYVKSSLGGNFQMASNDMLSRHTLLSLNNSQVWKDLTRDQIRINGELISGAEKGAEGILGTLVRTIVEKADAIRTILRVSALNEAKKNPAAKVSTMDYPTFELSEGQVLACARDLLVLCGRTQSGGDTYFCVDNMLINKEAEQGLCFLAPISSNSDPLEVTVSVVESDVRRQRQSIAHKGNEIADDISVEIADRVAKVKQRKSLIGQSEKSTELDQNHPHKEHPSLNGIAHGSAPALAIVLDDDGNSSKGNVSPAPLGADRESGDYLTLHEEWESVSTMSDLTLDTDMSGGNAMMNANKRVLSAPLKLSHPSSLPNNLSTTKIVGSSRVASDQTIQAVHPAFRRKSTGTGAPSASTLDKDNERRTSSSAVATKMPPADQAIGSESPSSLFANLSRPLTGIFGGSSRERKRTSSLNSPVEKMVGKDQMVKTVDSTDAYVPDMCIRVNVTSISRFRVCDMNPQDEKDANWAVVHGVFQQCFFIKSNCNGRPSMSDRVVTIVVDSVNDTDAL